MKYVKLGSTGLDVSAIGLGGSSYGGPAGKTHTWGFDEEHSRPFLKAALAEEKSTSATIPARSR